MVKNKLSLTVGITTCYGDDSILETVRSIRAPKGIAHFRFILIADRVLIKPHIKRKLKKFKVELIENKDEGSQVRKQRQILALTKSDIIFFIQDDVLFRQGTFRKVLKTFENNPEVTLVSIRNQHLPPLTFFEDIINVGTRISNTIAKNWRGGDSYLSCIGRFMAFRSQFLKEKINIPEEVTTTDAYYYFSNKFSGGKFLYLPNVEVFFRNPQNMKEHLRKSSRFQYSKLEMSRYFNDLNKEYEVPKSLVTRAILKEFVHDPLKTLLYLGVNFYTKVKRLRSSKVLNPIWEVDLSTKKISR